MWQVSSLHLVDFISVNLRNKKKIENLLTDQSSKFHLDDFAESMFVVFSVCHER